MIKVISDTNCKNCNKLNVCKYVETATKTIERLENELKKELKDEEIPLSLNIKCQEFYNGNPILRKLSFEDLQEIK